MKQADNYDRFCKNIERVNDLILIYEQNKQSLGKGSTDILRSAVVFLHASQEDYLRSILTDALSITGSKDLLNKVALADTSGRAEKFALGALIPFAEMTIDELIRLSVRQQMSKTSFNSYGEIATWMREVNVNLRDFKRQTLIENLIKRRHKIVHEVDMASGDRNSASAIDVRTVTSWKEAVFELITLIDRQIITTQIDSQGRQS